VKRRWIVPTIIVVVAIGGFLIYSFIPRVIVHTPPAPEPFNAFAVEYTLVGETSYDPSFFYENLGFVKDSDCTACEFVRGEGYDHLDELSTEGKFEVPEGLNHDKYSYIVAYGRKIVDLEAVGKNGSDYILCVTFEQEHEGNVVFLYQLDKIPIYPFSWPLYIMNGNEKVYWGSSVTDINEKDIEHPRYKGAK